MKFGKRAGIRHAGETFPAHNPLHKVCQFPTITAIKETSIMKKESSNNDKIKNEDDVIVLCNNQLTDEEKNIFNETIDVYLESKNIGIKKVEDSES